jgi:hypothetical protein
MVAGTTGDMVGGTGTTAGIAATRGMVAVVADTVAAAAAGGKDEDGGPGDHPGPFAFRMPGKGEQGMNDRARLGMIYRRAYGFVRDRIERGSVYADPTELRVDPTEAAGSLEPATLADPDVQRVIAEAIADAKAGRRPTW